MREGLILDSDSNSSGFGVEMKTGTMITLNTELDGKFDQNNNHISLMLQWRTIDIQSRVRYIKGSVKLVLHGP